MAVLLALFAPQVAGFFTKDAVLIAKIIPYFYIVPVTIFAYGFVFVSAAGLNAIGRPIYGLIYTIIRSVILYVGLIFIGVQLDDEARAHDRAEELRGVSGVLPCNKASGLVSQKRPLIEGSILALIRTY